MSVEANTATLQIHVWLVEASQNVQNIIDPHNDIDLTSILNFHVMQDRCLIDVDPSIFIWNIGGM